MNRPSRIRRTLALRVSEPRTGAGLDENSPGQRFAAGWALYSYRAAGQFCEETLAAASKGDPVIIAGFLAAKGAWDAHHFATNWIDR